MPSNASGASGPLLRILAIDPGRQKCGLAVSDVGGHALWRQVLPTAEVVATLPVLAQQYGPFAAVVLGDGTGSDALEQAIREADVCPRCPIHRVSEHLSSQEARALFLRQEKLPWWLRLLPPGLRFPNRPYDDYVAVILARRFLRREFPSRSRE